MNFFQYYNQIDYTFADEETPTLHYSVVLTDITLRAQIAERTRQFTSVFYDYVIPDGERPDLTAVQLYGDVRFTWVVLLTNNIFSPYDWPLSIEEFDRYMESRYGTLARAQAITTLNDYYFDTQGNVIPYDAYAALPILDKGKVLPARYCYGANGERIDPVAYDALHASNTRVGSVRTPYDYELDINERKRRIRAIQRPFLTGLVRELKTLFIV